MCNALINRPDDGGKWNEVHDAGCVHQVVEGTVVTARPLGIYSLHSLYLDDGLPRISGLRTISKPTLLYLATPHPGTTELELICLIRGMGQAQKEPEEAVSWGAGDEEPQLFVEQPPTSNKRRAVRLRLEADAPDFMGNTVADLKPLVHHSDSEDEDPEEREELMLLGQQVNDLIHNYPIQIFARSPNRKVNEKTKSSWCLLTVQARHAVTTKFMCDVSRLPKLFISCVVFEGCYEKWDDSIAALFPTLSEWHELNPQTKKSQGLIYLEVWRPWGQVLVLLDTKAGKLLVQRTRKYINNHWKWLPYISKGTHLWSTGLYQTRSTRIVRDKNVKNGPWIVINPRR
ncbi:hypothetical protein FRC08_004467 [Ceratobasidium sp. 394]|nr:hypothetical protein FRC08_004467 [Ceratobasidium sp. 394]